MDPYTSAHPVSISARASGPRRSLPSRTEYHRMNFLLQASDLLLKGVHETTVAEPGKVPQTSRERLGSAKCERRKRIRLSDKKANGGSEACSVANLTRIFPQQAKQVARKAVLRLDPACKRQLCRRCWIQLRPGLTSSIRVRRDKQKKLFKITTCLECGYFVRLPCAPKRGPRSEQIEAEVIS